MEDYKIDVINTRKGCLGGSDGHLIQQISTMEYVPRSAYKRLAIVKGLIEPDSITTRAMQYGNFIEQSIYSLLVQENENYESNPLWVSNKFSKPNCKLICHPDFVLVDEQTQTINCYECKATRYDVKATKETYRSQMFIEWLLANEKALERGKYWKVQVFLCHYNTDGVDMDDEFTFDADRLSIHRMHFKRNYMDVEKAMALIDAFLDNFNEYYEGDEIDSKYLPETVRSEFDVITNMIVEIKEREQRVDDFKKRLYDFMLEKDIKSIKNELWSITRVDATESKSFDSKKYVEYLKEKYPRKAKKIINEYTKITKRKGSVQIRLNTREDKQ